MRFFNTAGPCDPRFHYMLPAAERLPEVPGLVARGAYFVVHAPRQTGKTTTLKALARALTAEGQYAVLHFNCETGQVVEDDYVRAQRDILATIRARAERELPAELQPPTPWPEAEDTQILTVGLRAWARSCPRPLALCFDEIDSLQGKSLLSVLRQLRASYDHRPEEAPWSVVLCGLRDVRDYKVASGGDPSRLGTSSPFNMKVKSMRLGNFTEGEVAALYAQHTAEAGQTFTESAVARAFALTAGQPWLVNALAHEIIDEMCIAPPTPITVEHVEQAKERLIQTRATHLDSLVARLGEDRVRRIVEPLMAGDTVSNVTYGEDASYVHDLGLIVLQPEVGIANPIYREVIARVLGTAVEGNIPAALKGRFALPDGRLDMDALLRAFAEFWRENGEVLTGSLIYHEVAPQLVLMAFLQRIVNGGGFIDREYGLGRGRIDLLVRWPYEPHEKAGQRQWQREAIELKVWRDKKPDPRDEGLSQLDAYLDRLDMDRGWLVIFDRRASLPAGTPPAVERIGFEQAVTPSGRAVTILRA
jgi:AAA-like domain